MPLPKISFAKNDVGFIDPTGVDHDALGIALNKALYNYMHGIGLDADVRSWFSGRVPRTKVPRGYVARALVGVRIGLTAGCLEWRKSLDQIDRRVSDWLRAIIASNGNSRKHQLKSVLRSNSEF